MFTITSYHYNTIMKLHQLKFYQLSLHNDVAVPLLITKHAVNNYEFVYVRTSDWEAAM